jgi:hypothetical protein
MSGAFHREDLFFSRYFHVEEDGDSFIFSLQRPLQKNAVLRLRAGEVIREAKNGLSKIGFVYNMSFDYEFFIRPTTDLETACGVILKLDKRLDAIATRTLVPRLVEELLGISTRERLRWSKDGRLPRSGSVTFRKRHPITIATHPTDKMLELAANPSIIAEWRKRDELASAG